VRAEDWDRRYAATALLWSAEPNRFLASEAADLPPARALDLACGEGRNALWLAERGWRVTAADFSPVALGRARDLAARRAVEVEWVEADVREWRAPAGAFDLAAVLYLQLPREELRSVLDAAARALAPGGTLLVVAHDLANLAEGHGGPQDPAVLTTPEDVAEDLAGLHVERAERVERPVSLPDGGSARALDTLVRASKVAISSSGSHVG
jgi:SAM-dependent methyltransferase